MNRWIILFALYLWVTGIGWIAYYEAVEETEFKPMAKGLVLGTWPLLAVFATGAQIVTDVRAAWSGEEERDE